MRRDWFVRMALLAASALALPACKTTDTQRIELPERLGAPIGVLAIELPTGALADGEAATFDIEFEIGWRGTVERSSMRAASRPDLQDAVLTQHRQWVYAVATRSRPCAAVKFVGVQHIAISRTGSRLAMPLEPARVERRVDVVEAEWIGGVDKLRPESVTAPEYPRDALLAGAYGTVGVMFEFGMDGKARDAFTINAVNDRWGMTKAALATVSRYQLKEPPVRPLKACQTFEFTLRN